MPGDLCDLRVYILDRMDHSIGALTAARFAIVARDEFDNLCDQFPGVARDLLWETMAAASIQREWLVSAGQSSALGSLVHLVCEVHQRMGLVGLADRS